jgi:copper oxidase (laccase) domain-containing protein
MIGLGARASAIIAVVGPCIRQRSYQVGPEFRAAFVAAATDNDRWFAPSRQPGYWQFDLAGYLVDRLGRLGLARVGVLDHDTCADEARFFSYRRACLKGEKDYGRLVSAIALEP